MAMKEYSPLLKFQEKASPSDSLVSYLGHSLIGGGLLLFGDTVGVFYSPSRLGCCNLNLYAYIYIYIYIYIYVT